MPGVVGNTTPVAENQRAAPAALVRPKLQERTKLRKRALFDLRNAALVNAQFGSDLAGLPAAIVEKFDTGRFSARFSAF
jgi:hypothetical protein